eukprot:TRINITY_DN293_c0_g1_i2.p1 TRINITY_DN293_c0_g1~~TRINITY_DN293_c0_g1_i2.p1  ORF type:complete len:345 (+),score=47.15 TRINITY_DN293_c0_g1_i2:74-1108(+)
MSGKGYNENGSYEVEGGPSDCISSLSWSPPDAPKNVLVATSWDKTARVWDVTQSAPTPAAKCHATKGPECVHDLPVLCSAVTQDLRVFTGGCDKMVKCWELAAGKAPYQVAAHDQPVKSVKFISQCNILATGSWDSTVKFWDLRQPQPLGQIALAGPLVDMDCGTFPMATFLTGREIVVYDMQQRREIKRMEPHRIMKHQMRCIANFPDVTGNPGFAAGSIEGRVCIMHMNDSSKDYTFKCHRENGGSDVYAVHGIAFHHLGTFATFGSNGSFAFWDKDAKQRLRQFQNCDQSIPCGGFDSFGTLFAYAVSYDWSKGVEGYNSQKGNHILIHSVRESDIRTRSR